MSKGKHRGEKKPKLEAAASPDVSEEENEPEEELEEESFLRFLVSMMLTILVVLGGLAVIAGSVGSALGYYRIETVLSGSMNPEYPPGSIVVAFSKDKEKVQTGDVIIFVSPEQYGSATVTHRVIGARLTETGDVYVRTKGDANAVADPWEARVTTTEVWEVREGVPYVGYVAYYANRWWPLLLALALAFPMVGFANNRVREVYAIKSRKEKRNERRRLKQAAQAS